MSQELHTPGKLAFIEQGEANQFAVLDTNRQWLLSLLHNGEALTERQRANMTRLVAAWNFCDGLSTHAMETFPGPGFGVQTAPYYRLMELCQKQQAALQRLHDCDSTIKAATEDDLIEAANDAEEDEEAREQAAAFLQARAVMAEVKREGLCS